MGSRRRFAAALSYLCLGLLSLGLSACGDDDDDSVLTDAGQQDGGGKPPLGGDGGAAGSDGGSTSECSVEIKPGNADQDTIQGALIDARAGDTICLAKGRYQLEGQLSLSEDDVTVRGENGTVLDFTGQTRGANGIELTGSGDVLENVRIENPQGDGVRATQVNGVTFRKVHVEWTNGPSEDNGGYGIYPVSSSRVLIEDCFVSGASDSGIYVGQSEQIVVRNNEVTGNVAGIEIENSTDADVYGNHAHDNVAGILVFNLPGLRVKDGKRANVHDNRLINNNHENFAPEGNIVHDVPSGTGMFILAADDNRVFDNEIRGHHSFGVSIVSWYVALRDDEGEMDPEFDWFPEGNAVYGNTFADNGEDPKANASLIASLVGETTLADMVWDGIIDTDKLGLDASAGEPDEDGGEPLPMVPEMLRNCFHDNDGSFLYLDLEHDGASKTRDVAAFDCERPALPEVEL